MTKHYQPPLNGRMIGVRAEAGADPTKTLAELHKAFADFKAANDERIEALSKGKADVVTDEKVANIDATVAALQKSLDETMAKVAAAEMGGLGGDKKPRDPKYSAAFDRYARFGEDGADIRAALTKTDSQSGGYLSPVEWDRSIEKRLAAITVMRDLATVTPVKGTGIKRLIATGAFGSGWVGETAVRPETTTGQFVEVQYGWGEIYALPAASQQMLEDAEIDLEQWIAGEVEMTFSEQEEIAFVAGDGVNKPRGFLTYRPGGASAGVHPLGNVTEVNSGDAAAITADKLLDMIYGLHSRYRGEAKFVMNTATQGAIRKMKDVDGHYLWQPSMQEGQPATIFGYGIKDMPGMPDVAANAYPVAFGNFKRGYTIFDRRGIAVLRDPYTNKPYVMFYTTKRVGGGVTDPRAFRIMKIAL